MRGVGVLKKEMLIAYLYNIFAVGALTYLSVVFGKWWIVLFSLLFIHGVHIEKKVKTDDGDEEDG